MNTKETRLTVWQVFLPDISVRVPVFSSPDRGKSQKVAQLYSDNNNVSFVKTVIHKIETSEPVDFTKNT